MALLFFKQLNSKASDDLIGTFANPGDPPSLWDLLKRNKILQDSGLKFKIIEFGEEIPKEYKGLKCPAFRYIMEDGTEMNYPQNKELNEHNLVDWIANRTIVEMEKVTRIAREDEPPELINTDSTMLNQEQIEKVTEIVNKIPPKNFVSKLIDEHPLASYGIGIAFFSSVLIGIIGGSYIADRYNSKADEVEPLLLVNEEGKPAEFEWDETQSLASRDLILKENSIENVTSKNRTQKLEEEKTKTENGELIEITLQDDI